MFSVCVCVCVCFGSKSLTFFLLRDVFERLKYCLDLWLSSIVDCIHICIFLFFEKLFLSNLDSFSTPLKRLLSIEALFLLVSIEVNAISIHQETFCLLDRCLIAVRSIKVGFYSIAARQLLDLLRSSCMHRFSHVFHLSFILSSIASCFITFMHLYGFFVPP